MQTRSLMLLSLLLPTASLLITAAKPPHSKKTAKTVAVSHAAAPDTFPKEILPLVKQYCGGCHGAKEGSAGVSLLAFHTTADVLKSRAEWEKVASNVSSGHMPPEGMPKPTDAQRTALTGWIESTLSKAECNLNDPGHVTMHHLNREEYNNTIRDLTGMDLRPGDAFPNDDVGYGFDNNGDVLSISPLLLEKYLNAAESVSQAVVVTPEMMRRPTVIAATTFATEGESAPARDGVQLKATGSTAFTDRAFAASGDYILRVTAYGQQAGPDPARMVFMLDNVEVKTVDVPDKRNKPGTFEFPIHVTAGKHHLSFIFANDFYVPGDKAKKIREQNRDLIVSSLEITRPQGQSDPLPASNKRTLSVTPQSPAENDACARKVLGSFARRAFRRPVTTSETDRLTRYVRMATKEGQSWERGIQLGIQAILISPNFLFRVETDPTAKITQHPVSSYEMASRLSYFLWSSMPDEELFRLAAKDALQQPDVLAAQVKRMLRDPKAHALADNFAGQWLQLRKLNNVSPDPQRFPDFNDGLRQAMKTETEMFFEAIVREDRSVLDFLNARFTYLNAPLAKHYGIEGVTGDNFRRVVLTGDQRGGILSQASVLTVTSNPTRTSPVKRGKWVLENIFNTPPPPPPPNVPQLADENKGPLQGTLRQRMEEHRKNPVCASCHARMDPIGFGLENYDATGGWRTTEDKYAVDSSGVLYGQKFSTPAQLKTILLLKRTQFVRCLTEKMLIYGLGRSIESNDRCNVNAMVNRIEKSNDKFSALVTTVVQSSPFRMRRGDGGTH